jgi:hypothetical protein
VHYERRARNILDDFDAHFEGRGGRATDYGASSGSGWGWEWEWGVAYQGGYSSAAALPTGHTVAGPDPNHPRRDVQLLKDDLCSEIVRTFGSSAATNAKSLAHILPALLDSLALSSGQESSTQFHLDFMYYMHKHRQ